MRRLIRFILNSSTHTQYIDRVGKINTVILSREHWGNSFIPDLCESNLKEQKNGCMILCLLLRTYKILNSKNEWDMVGFAIFQFIP